MCSPWWTGNWIWVALLSIFNPNGVNFSNLESVSTISNVSKSKRPDCDVTRVKLRVKKTGSGPMLSSFNVTLRPSPSKGHDQWQRHALRKQKDPKSYNDPNSLSKFHKRLRPLEFKQSQIRVINRYRAIHRRRCHSCSWLPSCSSPGPYSTKS